jgi:hypothetical protein
MLLLCGALHIDGTNVKTGRPPHQAIKVEMHLHQLQDIRMMRRTALECIAHAAVGMLSWLVHIYGSSVLQENPPDQQEAIDGGSQNVAAEEQDPVSDSSSSGQIVSQHCGRNAFPGTTFRTLGPPPGSPPTKACWPTSHKRRLLCKIDPRLFTAFRLMYLHDLGMIWGHACFSYT